MQTLRLGGLCPLILVSILLLSCHPNLHITAYPSSGSPGDYIVVRLAKPIDLSKVQVRIGNAKAIIDSSQSDSMFTVMVPVLDPQQTRLEVRVGKGIGTTLFHIDKRSTVRLWFMVKGKEITFVKSQPSNESFVQNKSYSDNRWMYEIFNKSQEIIVTGFINNPLEYEVPTADKNGLTKIEQKRSKQFNVNVPALTDIYKIKFYAVNDSTGYKPRLLNESLVAVTNQ